MAKVFGGVYHEATLGYRRVTGFETLCFLWPLPKFGSTLEETFSRASETDLRPFLCEPPIGSYRKVGYRIDCTITCTSPSLGQQHLKQADRWVLHE
jgi:hypothetical protein